MSITDVQIPALAEQQPADDPVLQGVTPDRRVELEALGIPIMIETNDLRVERIARQSFGPRQSQAQPDDVITLRLLVHGVPEAPEWSSLQPVLRAQDDHFYIAASRASVVSGSVTAGFAFGFISEREADHDEHLRSTMIQSAVLWMVGHRTLSAIHCAVVTYGGRTVILRGRPNAGKTTLAYAALRRGFSMLGEDVAFAFENNGELELRGAPWLLYLLPDTVRFFPELSDLEPLERHNGESKILVHVGEAFPGQTVTTAPLGPTVFVERSLEGRNRFRTIEAEEALERLEQTRIAVEQQQAKGFDIWGTMLDHGAYVFEVGPDPLAAADALRAFCEG